MQQGMIVNLHLAQQPRSPATPVQNANVISGQGLEGDRFCREGHLRQVLLMDKETLDELELSPGQIKENVTTSGLDLSQTEAGQVVIIGDDVTLEIVGECLPCERMNAIRPGLRQTLEHRRGMLALVLNGGPIKVGDPIRVEP